MNAVEGVPGRRGIPASAIGEAVRHDPQFRVPSLPRLCRGLHVVDTPQGVVVEGAAERQHLRGESARALRASLFPLLDGSRDAAALAMETGWSAEVVRKAVAALYFAGLLEDAGAEVDPPPGPGPSKAAATWMSRTLDCSRVYPDSSHMARAAARSAVRLAVRTAWEAPLRESLADVGIVDVAAFDGGRDAGSDTLTVLDLAAPAELVDAVVESCARGGPPLLFADEHDGRVLVGPFVDPSATACARCARAAVTLRPNAPDWRAAPTPRSAIAAGLIAEEIRALLLRNESVTSLGGQLAVGLGTATSTACRLTPEVDCTTCYPSAAGQSQQAPAEAGAALHYEHAVGFPPRHLVNPKAHQHHFRPENVGLQFEQLRYPNNPRTALPDVTVEDLRACTDAGAVPTWLEALAAVLRFTVGLRPVPDRSGGAEPERVLRWAPTGGNLGSPHAYPLLQSCPGLPDGLYYYDAADHTLTAMHPHAEHVSALLGAQPEAVRDPRSGPLIHLVLASELGRVARKYGPFSYRVGNLDTGCALAQLTVVARQMGLTYRLLDPGTWQPHRESLLGVGGPPLITAVVQFTSDGRGHATD